MKSGLFSHVMLPTLFWVSSMIMGWEVSMLDAILSGNVFNHCLSLIYWLVFENSSTVDYPVGIDGVCLVEVTLTT